MSRRSDQVRRRPADRPAPRDLCQSDGLEEADISLGEQGTRVGADVRGRGRARGRGRGLVLSSSDDDSLSFRTDMQGRVPGAPPIASKRAPHEV